MRLADEIFGAARHDVTCWDRHPFVARSEVQFDGEWGSVSIWLRDPLDRVSGALTAVLVEPHATREGCPDVYVYGEGDCPIGFFENVPSARDVRISIEGPVENDSRTCWSAGIWLAV